MTDELEEIWLLYIDDGGQSLDAVEHALGLLRITPNDLEAIGLLFRSMHTFKGNSRILGLSNIERTAHIAEDLIGLVRDDGVTIDDEIINLLIETADTLRTMMDRAYQSRSDIPAEGARDLPERLQNKVENCRADRARSAVDVSSIEQSQATLTDGDAPFTDALVFDASIVRLADDPVYREIFLDTARSAIEEMRLSLREGGGKSESTIDRLITAIGDIRDMAERIAMPDWPEIASSAEAEIKNGAEIAPVIDRLDDLYKMSVEGISAGSRIHGAEAVDTADDVVAVVPSDVVEALREILRCSADETIEEQSFLVSATTSIAAWADQSGYPGIVDACLELSQLASGKHRIDVSAFQLADYLSRLECDSKGAATRLFGEWSLARSAGQLTELSRAIAGTPIDWDQIASSLRSLGPAFANCELRAACESIQLMADVCCRVRDGDVVAHESLPALFGGLANGLRVTFEGRTGDIGPDFSAAEALLIETAEAVGRICRDPRLDDLENNLGLPESFRGALSTESAERLTAAVDAGLKLYVVHADLGQDQVLSDRFAEWIGMPGRSSICSVTVFRQDSTAFDYLIAAADDADEMREALRRIGSGALSLTRCVEPRRERAQATPNGLTQLDERLGEADALSAIVGELVTARSATRQMLASFVEADIPAQTDRMLEALGDNHLPVRDTLSQLITGWHDKIEQLLQIEAKVAADLDQLSTIATRIRQRPAGDMLDRIVALGRDRAAARGKVTEFTCVGEQSSIDIAHLSSLESALRLAIEFWFAQHVVPDAVEIKLSAGETAFVAMMTLRGSGRIGENPEAPSEMTRDVPLDRIDKVLCPVGGYAAVENSACGVESLRISIPRQTAVIDGMIVRVRDTKYVLPVQSIQRIVETPPTDVVHVMAESSQRLLRLEPDDILPVRSLVSARQRRCPTIADSRDDMTYRDGVERDEAAHSSPLFVITSTRDGRIAVPVDELLGQESIVVRPVQGYLASLRAVSGCTILAAGDIGIVVDPNAIARAAA